MSNPKKPKQGRVICICGGFGFPHGTASTKRIVLVGRALILDCFDFHVWHIGPSPFKDNKEKRGTYKKISFKYLSPTPKWHGKFTRMLCYLSGCCMLPLNMFRERSKSIVYCYYQGNLLNFYILLLCRLFRIPVVQEACEWWPETHKGNFFTDFMYRKVMFKWSDAALPISHLIEERIRFIAGPGYPACRIPVLVDPAEGKPASQRVAHVNAKRKKFLWCGIVHSYKRDVKFLIESFSLLKSAQGKEAILMIVGPCHPEVKDELLSYASEHGIERERIEITGFVTEEELWEHCVNAFALLMPLWEDDRSNTRFPTKLGQYVASGRPIVTVNVGEIKHFLTDETAFFYRSGQQASLASTLDRLLELPDLGSKIAAQATKVVLPQLDFTQNASRLGSCFKGILP